MQIKRCIILYNNFNREYEYLEIIKKVLEEEFGVQTQILSRFPSSYLLKAAFSFKPNAILTFPLTSKGLSTELHLLKFFLGCKIVTLRTEGVYNYESERDIRGVSGQDVYSKYLVDFEVFWGPKPAKIIGEILHENNKISSLDRIKYFGYPKWEIDNKPNEELVALKKHIDENNFQNTLFFITGFHVCNYDNKEKILHARDVPEEYISDLIRYSELGKQFRKDLEKTINIAAKENNDLFFIVKLHPLESIEDYNFNLSLKNLKIINNDQKVHDLLKISDYFFHYGSTSAAEAYILNKPVFYYYDTPLNEFFSDLKWPSNKHILIEDLILFLKRKEFRNFNSLPLNITEGTLKDHFNYIKGEEYKPSFSLAKLISDEMNAQPIHFYDKYFLRSLLKFIYKVIKNIFR